MAQTLGRSAGSVTSPVIVIAIGASSPEFCGRHLNEACRLGILMFRAGTRRRYPKA
jgi:hypothetical protein